MDQLSIIRTLFFIAVLLCLSTGSQAAEWTSVQTPHFHVIGEVTEAEVRSVAARLENYRDAFGRLFPKVRTDSRNPVRVLIFRDAESYRDFRPRNPDGSPDHGIAGYYLAGEGVNYITLAMQSGKTDPFHTVFHEYVHFLLRANAGSSEIPAWLGEGLAQYFETMRLTADGTAVIGDPPQGRLNTLRRNAMLPWSEVFAAERSSLDGTAEASRSVFYAQSWLLVHHLMQSGSGGHQTRLDRFLGILARGSTSDHAIKEAFAIDAAELGRSLAAYLALPALPVTTANVSGGRTTIVESPSVKVPGPQARAYLGDLLLHMNRIEDAEPHLRTAIAGDSSLWSAHASLGFLLIGRDMPAEALKHLELAVTKGQPSYLDHFNYAHALSRVSSKDGAEGRFPEPAAEKMRIALKRSIELEPAFPESYRLLAYLNYVNEGDAGETALLLEKGLSLKPGNEGLEMLLAKVRLRQERMDEARRLAEKLKAAKDPEIRNEAAEFLSSLTQFIQAKLQITTSAANRALPGSPGLVLLKRSWVTEADLAAVEKLREMGNLNRLLERPRPSEERLLGTIEQIECSKGTIAYNIRSGSERMRFIGERFDEIRMGVLVSGQHTFKIDCGVRLPANPVVLMYLRQSGKRAAEDLRLTSITFVPDNFELWPPERLAAARAIVIEDDLVRRDRNTAEGFATAVAGPEARWASIAKNLRRVDQDERRVAGELEAVECTQDGFNVVAAVDGKKMRFAADTALVPAWFSVSASQAPMTCGARPKIQNVLFTFRANRGSGEADARLTAMEFLPEGFPLEKISAPAH